MPLSRPSYILFVLLISSVFAYAQKPVIAEVNPTITPMGGEVIILGSGFDANPANLVVRFGSADGVITEARENLIAVRVPSGSTYRTLSVTNLLSGLTGYTCVPNLLSYSGDILDAAKFDVPLDFLSESELYDLTLEDFDGDGKLDIATANNNSNLITIYKNTSTAGAVSFTKQFITISSPTINVTSRDLNGDGKPELLVSKSGNPGDRVYYMKNTSTPGTISFTSPQFLLISGNIARRVEVVDLDKNGKPEVIVTNQSNNMISYFNNTSSGGAISFSTAQTIDMVDDANASLHSAGLAICDLNGDGFADIATTQFLEKDIYITPNTSSVGSLSFGATIKIPLVGNMSFIKAADINRDGKNDLIVSKLQQNQISILINNGTGDNISFENEVTYTVNEKPWGISIGDLNGDGKLDIAVASINSADKKFSILENTSTTGSMSFMVKHVATPEITRNIKVGDIDTDGKPDVVVTSLGTTQYNVTVIRNKNCFVPRMAPEGPLDLCTNAEVTLQATPSRGTTYTWKRSDNTVLGTGTDPFFTFIAAVGSFDYYVEASSESSDCITQSNLTTINVSNGVIPNPPTIVDPVPACAGQNITMTIDPATLITGATYTWERPDGTTSTGESLSLTNISLSDGGRYLLSAFDGGCESSIDTTYLEVVIPPNITIVTSGDLVFCNGNSVTLEVENDPNFSYKWFKDNVEIPSTNSATYTTSTSGDYTVEVTNAYNCQVVSNPVTTLSAMPPVAGIDAQATSCVGNTVTFTNTSVVQSGIPVYYSWNFGDGTQVTDQNPTHTFASANTYNVSLTVSYDDVTCTNTTNHSIIIADPPTIVISADVTEFCTGASANLSITGTFASVLWSTTESTNSITVTQGGNYSVTITTADGCQATSNIDIIEFPLPVITITPIDPMVELGESIQLQASGASTYSWDPITGLDDPNIPNPLATPETTTVYTVTGIDANQCEGSGEITVTVVIPEPILTPQLMFSPNGDGINDLWVIENIEDCIDCTLAIYDRSGIKIFEEVNYSQSWNGRYNGEDLIEDVYYFVVSNGTDKIKSGSITLIR